MKNLIEELVFLELTNKQFVRFPNSRYYEIIGQMDDSEKEEFYILSNIIHDVWNRVNGHFPEVEDQKDSNVNSLSEYHEKVEKLDDIIIKVSNEFNLTLKREHSDGLKRFVIDNLGIEFWNKTFGED